MAYLEEVTLVVVLAQLQIVVLSFDVVLPNLEHLGVGSKGLGYERARHLLNLEYRLGAKFLVIDLFLHVPRLYLQVSHEVFNCLRAVTVAEVASSPSRIVAAIDLKIYSVTNHRTLITLEFKGLLPRLHIRTNNLVAIPRVE